MTKDQGQVTEDNETSRGADGRDRVRIYLSPSNPRQSAAAAMTNNPSSATLANTNAIFTRICSLRCYIRDRPLPAAHLAGGPLRGRPYDDDLSVVASTRREAFLLWICEETEGLTSRAGGKV
jgi:hypothetical protein